MRIGVMLRHIQEKGGIVTYTKNLLKSLIPLSPQHEFALLYNNSELLGTYSRYPNVAEHVLSAKNKFLWDQWAVPRAAKALGIDVIINPKLSIPLWGPQSNILVLRPEQFVHPELFKPLDRQYFKIFMPLYCGRADRILVPARKAAEDVVRYIRGATAEKTVWVHEGCGDHFFLPPPSADELEAVRRRYGLPQRYVLFVGGINPLKNFTRLVEAFAQVRQRHDIPLVVVGFKRWAFEKDVAFAKNHEVSSHIQFPGYVPDEDMPHIYRMATVLFLPSIYEGFGIPVTEAFSCDCPVVTSTTGSSPEVAGGAALLVDPFDVDDMARGLELVLSNEGLRQELIEKGHSRAPEFRFERCARQTLQVIEQLAPGPRQTSSQNPLA